MVDKYSTLYKLLTETCQVGQKPSTERLSIRDLWETYAEVDHGIWIPYDGYLFA